MKKNIYRWLFRFFIIVWFAAVLFIHYTHITQNLFQEQYDKIIFIADKLLKR